MDEARQVRDFWFGRQPFTAETVNRRMQLWFGLGASDKLLQQRDEFIRTKFGTLVDRAARGELDAWADSPRRLLSLILLLDQFPRNIYRGTARAFAQDQQALALTLGGMQSGADAALDVVQRIFFYMPLQHAESAEAQDESVAAYRRLLAESPQELRNVFESCVKYADLHRDVIRRFGRFPHRNRVLGRPSTAEEEAYLNSGGERFGQ